LAYRQVDNQYRWSVNVWCGIVNGYLIDPYFFDGNVNKENFMELLRDRLPQLLKNIDLHDRKCGYTGRDNISLCGNSESLSESGIQ